MPRGKKTTDVDKINQKVDADERVETKKKATSAKRPRTKRPVDGKTDSVDTGNGKGGSQKEIEEVDAELVEKRGYGTNGNLRSFGDLSTSELREIQSRGGKNSGAARRHKKELREFTKDFLLHEAAPIIQNNMRMLGVEADDMSNLAAIVVRLFNKAVNNGDLNSARTLIEWAGMAPLQQERENEAIAKMSQAMQLANGNSTDDDEETDVVFYIPENGRPIIRDEDLVGGVIY